MRVVISGSEKKTTPCLVPVLKEFVFPPRIKRFLLSLAHTAFIYHLGAEEPYHSPFSFYTALSEGKKVEGHDTIRGSQILEENGT